MDGRVIVFAGTTEGRSITKLLGDAGVNVLACVSTEFGRSMIEESGTVEVSSKRLGEEGMHRILEDCSIVIDATHPYAAIISAKIRNACKEKDKRYVRVLRGSGRSEHDDVVEVPDVSSAVEYLKGTTGNILVTTGSKELERFTELEGFKDRVYGRVLSIPSVSQKCSEYGLEGKNIFCMKGPFCEELNYGMLKQVDAKYLVTKDSGEPGGFADKMQAALRAGVKVILIGRPEGSDEGYTYEEVVNMLRELYGISKIPSIIREKRRMTIVGIGMGDLDSLTEGSRKSIYDADLIVGAPRMVRLFNCQNTLEEYSSDVIFRYLNEHMEFRKIVILVSGDTGYRSATKKIVEGVDKNEFDVDIKCGISSISYLCSKIGTSWDDAHLISSHGKDVNLICNISRYGKTISLMDGPDSVRELCLDLIYHGMDNVEVTVGQDMGGLDEVIVTGSPSDLKDMGFGTLCTVLVENPCPRRYPLGISDDEFIRGDAPMTKSEVRSLSISKLGLSEDSIVYDIGAGTGSVSIEMALQAIDGKVYAIEKESDAAQLIAKNMVKFRTPNVHIIKGVAPDAMKGLPPPTHVFIGGSSGNLKEIISDVLLKNPKVRIVMNCITLETISEALECIKGSDIMEREIVSVSVSKAKKASRYHLMEALNPVYIIVLEGNAK